MQLGLHNAQLLSIYIFFNVLNDFNTYLYSNIVILVVNCTFSYTWSYIYVGTLIRGVQRNANCKKKHYVDCWLHPYFCIV